MNEFLVAVVNIYSIRSFATSSSTQHTTVFCRIMLLQSQPGFFLYSIHSTYIVLNRWLVRLVDSSSTVTIISIKKTQVKLVHIRMIFVYFCYCYFSGKCLGFTFHANWNRGFCNLLWCCIRLYTAPSFLSIVMALG